MTNFGWGQGANNGFYTLLPYGMAVAKDGTVWMGFQDNGSGHIEPDTREMFMDFEITDLDIREKLDPSTFAMP